jgi:hypothetical protein
MGNEYHYLTVSAYVMNMVFNIIRKIIYFTIWGIFCYHKHLVDFSRHDMHQNKNDHFLVQNWCKCKHFCFAVIAKIIYQSLFCLD